MITGFFKKKASGAEPSASVEKSPVLQKRTTNEICDDDDIVTKKAKVKEADSGEELAPAKRKRLRKAALSDSEEEENEAAPVEEEGSKKEAPESPAMEVEEAKAAPAPSPVKSPKKAPAKAASGMHSFFGKPAAKEKKSPSVKESTEKSAKAASPAAKAASPAAKDEEAPAKEASPVKKAAGKGDDKAEEWVTWKKGASVPYQVLAEAFDEVAGTTKRLEIIAIMAKMFRSVICGTPQDLLPVVYLAINKVAPEYEGIELGIGESILMKALAESCGSNVKAIKEKYNTVGDLGIVAADIRSKQKQMFKPKPLLIQEVFSKFRQIADASGSKSGDLKKSIIMKLLSAAVGVEARFIISGMQGKLRIGLAEQTVLVALSQAIALSGPEEGAATRLLRGDKLTKALDAAEAVIKASFSEKPSYDAMIPCLLEHGSTTLLDYCYLTPGVPTKPMLAKPTKGITEVLDRFANTDFVCEYKYDGERAQVHLLEDGTIKVFSRNLEDNTGKYPDIVASLPSAVKPGVKSFVIDSECVAFDRETNTILPFQKIQSRARKGVKLEDITCHVCLYAFDILYLDGKPLLRENLETRRAALRSAFNVVPGMFNWTQSATKADLGGVEEIQLYLDEAVKGMTEGLMVKTLSKDASYEPSRRTFNWLKIKKDYLAGCTDSFDLVPIAGYRGKGKRAGVYGAYLLASYDEDSECWQAITKIGTGFSDEILKEHTKFLDGHKVDSQPSYYQFNADGNSACEPDTWFEPCQVWEVLAADLSISPVYQSAVGIVHDTKGIALRFPRFIRIRDDKNADQATNGEQVAEMYRNQAFIGGAKGNGGGISDDDN